MTALRGPRDVVGSFGVAMENDSSRVQVIGQAGQEAIESGGIDLSNSSREFGRVAGVEVAQPDDRRAMKTTRREVRVARLNQLIPVGHLLVQLGANPTNKLGLIRAGK